MNDSEMDITSDAATEIEGIKGALDHEVARRFDADHFTAVHARALARARVDDPRWRASARDPGTGPFVRVPVPLQWIGLAAAIVAAATGIRSVYREWTAPAPEAIEAQNDSVPAVAGSAPAIEEAPAASAEPAPPPAPSGHRRREADRPDELDGGSGSEPDIGTASVAEDSSLSAPPPDHEARASRPGPAAPTIVGGTVALAPADPRRTGARSSQSPTPAPIPGGLIATGAVQSGEGVVRVAGDSLLRQGLAARIRAVPEIQATLVAIRGVGRRVGPVDISPGGVPDALDRPAQGRGPSARSKGVHGEQTGSPTPLQADPAQRQDGRRDGRRSPSRVGRSGARAPEPAAQDVDPIAGPRDERQDVAPDPEGEIEAGVRKRGSAGEAASSYYVRAFLGSAFDNLSQDDQGYLGKGTEAIPLRSRESWGSPRQTEALRRVFDLRSLVPIDGVRMAEPSREGATEGTLIVAAARRIYEVLVSAEPAEDAPGGHLVTVRVSRKLAPGSRSSGTREMEIPVFVTNGAVAVLCIPEALLSGEGTVDVSTAQNTLFLALSPRFGDLAPGPDLEPPPSGGRWNDPAVVADRVDPRYPDEARALGIEGEVVLGATVLRDGGVDGVHVVSIPEEDGAELLIEAASSAVRRWRFLPARVHGAPVDSLVTMTIRFRLARRQE